MHARARDSFAVFRWGPFLGPSLVQIGCLPVAPPTVDAHVAFSAPPLMLLLQKGFHALPHTSPCTEQVPSEAFPSTASGAHWPAGGIAAASATAPQAPCQPPSSSRR